MKFVNKASLYKSLTARAIPTESARTRSRLTKTKPTTKIVTARLGLSFVLHNQ